MIIKYDEITLKKKKKMNSRHFKTRPTGSLRDLLLQSYITSNRRINKYYSQKYIYVKLQTIYYQLFLYSSKHTEETRGASVHASLLFKKKKIIARDHRSRHPQTLIPLHINKWRRYTSLCRNYDDK